MKLSKTAWNNVIIFSVMIIILLINTSNDHLFPEDNNNDALLLPEHSIVLTLAVFFPNNSSITFERIGRSWQMTSQGVLVDLTNQQIEQLMFAWQQSSGLVQAADIVINAKIGIQVNIDVAGIEPQQQFILYPLTDQLLVYNVQKKLWLALPKAVAHQLIPNQKLLK